MSSYCLSTSCLNGNCIGCKDGTTYCNDPRCYPNCPNCLTNTKKKSWWSWNFWWFVIIIIVLIVLVFLLFFSFRNKCYKIQSKTQNIKYKPIKYYQQSEQTQLAQPLIESEPIPERLIEPEFQMGTYNKLEGEYLTIPHNISTRVSRKIQLPEIPAPSASESVPVPIEPLSSVPESSMELPALPRALPRIPTAPKNVSVSVSVPETQLPTYDATLDASLDTLPSNNYLIDTSNISTDTSNIVILPKAVIEPDSYISSVPITQKSFTTTISDFPKIVLPPPESLSVSSHSSNSSNNKNYPVTNYFDVSDLSNNTNNTNNNINNTRNNTNNILNNNILNKNKIRNNSENDVIKGF